MTVDLDHKRPRRRPCGRAVARGRVDEEVDAAVLPAGLDDALRFDLDQSRRGRRVAVLEDRIHRLEVGADLATPEFPEPREQHLLDRTLAAAHKHVDRAPFVVERIRDSGSSFE